MALNPPLRNAHKTFHFIPFYFICILSASSLPHWPLRVGGKPSWKGTALSSLEEGWCPLGQAPPVAEQAHRPRGCGQGRSPSDALWPWAPRIIRKVKHREVWGRNERAKPGGAVCAWLIEAEVDLGAWEQRPGDVGSRRGPDKEPQVTGELDVGVHRGKTGGHGGQGCAPGTGLRVQGLCRRL